MTIEELPEETRLIQLAEECSELAQAALKLVRVLHGDTPVSRDEAVSNLIEEIADVDVCVFVLSDIAPSKEVCEKIVQKKQRWESRINEKET